MELRKRPGLNKKPIVITGAVMLAFIIVYTVFSSFVRPGLAEYASMRIQAICTDEIYNSVLRWMPDNVDEYVTVMQSENQVYYVEMNNMALNKLAANCANDIQKYVNESGKQGVMIPLGTISGIPLLAGMGPNINLYFYPLGTSQIDFKSEFRSAGINQTLHSVNAVVNISVALVLPGETYTVPTCVTMTLSEHIIVGKVPGAYLQGDSGGVLNLTPSG